MGLLDWAIERSVDCDDVRRLVSDVLARPVWPFDIDQPASTIPDDVVLCQVVTGPGQFPTRVA